MSKELTDKLKIQRATAEAEAKNKKNIHQRRIEAIRAVRQKKSKAIGSGEDMVVFETVNPDKVVKQSGGRPRTDYPHERAFKKRAAVMEQLGPELGAPSEVVKTSKNTYLVQDKAPIFQYTDEYPDWYVDRGLQQEARKKNLDIYDLHDDNIGTSKKGRPILRDAGRADFDNPKLIEKLSKDITVKKYNAGKIRRTLPIWLMALLASNPEKAEAMMRKIPEEAYPLLDAMEKADPANIQEMGYDRSFEPNTVEYQKRMAAERLIRAIKERNNGSR